MLESIIKKTIAVGIAFSMIISFTSPIIAYTKEETIYSKTDANGKRYETIVSTLNENYSKSEEVDADTPIEYEVTYKLDGKNISANEVAGKKGRVTITITFKNKEEQIVNLDGKAEKMYTPFLVISGIILNNTDNKNIEISQGKIVNNGKSSIVIGYAVPGLVDSLKLKNYNISLSDKIEISLDTDKFEMENILTYASPKLFSELNINTSEFDLVFNKINELKTASNKIETGAKSLNDGIKQLDEGIIAVKDGSSKLNNGAKNLQDGAKQLNSGATTLKNGISEYSASEKEFNNAVGQVSAGVSNLNTKYSQLDNGINMLNDSSSLLESGASTLASGTEQVSNNLNIISEKLEELSTGATKLNNGIGQIQGGVNQLISGVENSTTQTKIKNIAGNEQKIAVDINQSIAILNAQIENTDDPELKAKLQEVVSKDYEILNYLSENGEEFNSISDESKSLRAGLEELKTNLREIKTGTDNINNGLSQISSNTSILSSKTEEIVGGVKQLHEGTVELTSGTSKLVNGSSEVASGIGTLDYGTTSLADASNQLTEASNKISDGAENLKNGTVDLMNGVNTLKEGTEGLELGTITLSNGSKQLVEGSNELYEGIEQFNIQGIGTIVNIANNQGKSLLKRISKLEELAKNYEFTYNDKDKYNNVQFISMTDSIKLKENGSEN